MVRQRVVSRDIRGHGVDGPDTADWKKVRRTGWRPSAAVR
jgi:hypothetical protein